MMGRSVPLGVILLAGFGLACGGIDPARGAGGPADRRPNLLVILADDLGAGDLGWCGAPDLRTPHLDALAAAGMRFGRFHANAPVCSPTRAALLTGRYPDLVGVPGVIRTHPEDSWGCLAPRATLLPRLLKDAGYHTGCVGKWHLGLEGPDRPEARGFDTFRGFLGDMMDDYTTHRRHGLNYLRRDGREVDPEGHATDLFTAWGIEYLEERKHDARPFFLYLAYNAPHAPIQPPTAWLERVRRREPGLDDRRARLVALIEHLDDGIGRVLGALRANGQAGETLVIFTSDNGGQLDLGARCGPVRGGKGDLYEGGLRVPMCAAWPGRIAPGAQSDRVALTMDLHPTLCAAAGVAPGPEVDGVSLLPTLLGRGDPEPADRDLFWMRREGGPRYHGRDYFAARRGDWKLMQNGPFEPYRLYHLGDDPLEAHDRSAGEPAVVAELSRALRGHIRRAGAVPWQAPPWPADGEGPAR